MHMKLSELSNLQKRMSWNDGQFCEMGRAERCFHWQYNIIHVTLCSIVCLFNVLYQQGGRHVDYVADQVITKLIDTVKKKNKGGMKLKPFQVQ